MTINWCDSVADSIEQGEAQCTDSPTQKSSHRTSLDALYREHRPALLKHLSALVKDADLAEELLHDTFIRLSNMPVLSVIRQPRPFLFKVASNIALDHLRKRQRTPDTESDKTLESWASPGPSQTELIAQERRIKQLYKTIEALPPRAREALLLARMKELTIKEVAQQLGVSQTMVEKHLRNALKKCRAALTSELH